jgi:hypothetical protein
MDERSFVAIYEQCSSALKEYVAQAEETCNMLRGLEGKPLNAADLKSVMAQRSRENEAHRKYMEVRERLLEAAQRGYRAG